MRHYIEGADLVRGAVSAWVEDIHEGRFPTEAESYEARPVVLDAKIPNSGAKKSHSN